MHLQENISLQSLNTFGIAANARYYSLINSQATLKKLLNNNSLKSLPKLIVGGASNILFVKDFDGWIIHMNIQGVQKTAENNNHIWLQIGAGVRWHQLVLYCIERGYAGIENLSLIPGTVGAAPIQNIGAYGVEFSEVFESLEALEINTGIIKNFNKINCSFGYRDSIFKKSLQGEYIILRVTIRLNKQPTLRTTYGAIQDVLAAMNLKTVSIKSVSDAIIHLRQQKLPNPAYIGNAGSFFKNPIISPPSITIIQGKHPNIPMHILADGYAKIPAAWLIEQCGWKGYRQGAAGVHAHQPLVIVNYGGATGEEIYQLALNIQTSVKDKFGILLEPEVNIVR
jgi:UDP-N-acetylmuramate dehydrogenase